MDAISLTALVQGAIEVILIVGAFWGISTKKQKVLETNMNKKIDRMEMKFYSALRQSEGPRT